MSKLKFPGTGEAELTYESGPSSHNPLLPNTITQAELLLEALFARRGVEYENIRITQADVRNGENHTSYDDLKEVVLTGHIAHAIDAIQQIDSLIGEIANNLSIMLRMAYEQHEQAETGLRHG